MGSSFDLETNMNISFETIYNDILYSKGSDSSQSKSHDSSSDQSDSSSDRAEDTVKFFLNLTTFDLIPSVQEVVTHFI